MYLLNSLETEKSHTCRNNHRSNICFSRKSRVQLLGFSLNMQLGGLSTSHGAADANEDCGAHSPLTLMRVVFHVYSVGSPTMCLDNSSKLSSYPPVPALEKQRQRQEDHKKSEASLACDTATWQGSSSSGHSAPAMSFSVFRPSYMCELCSSFRVLFQCHRHLGSSPTPSQAHALFGPSLPLATPSWSFCVHRSLTTLQVSLRHNGMQFFLPIFSLTQSSTTNVMHQQFLRHLGKGQHKDMP